jgi:PAS domain S-box-containing protein
MVIVDGDGRICFANRQVSALFGHEAADLVGEPVEVLLPERFRARHGAHRARYGAAMTARPMGTGLDLFALRRDGSEFPAEISLSPIERDGEVLVVTAIRDVTLQKRAEGELLAAREAADAANRAKSRFLAAASHDLRQPLQTLSMLNGTLLRTVKTPAVIDALGHQAQAIGAMSKLLNSLLDISKLESGAIRPEVTDFEVAALFEELRAEFSAIAQRKGLELRLEACRGHACSDPLLLSQILRNLISNAIKYTREGWVQVRCLHERSRLRIEVLDTGIGMAPDELARIFDEFYQANVPANTARDGYGLGLSIVDRLVRLLGLELQVQSQPGKGSCFVLAVPAGAAGSASGSDTDRRGAAARRAGRHVVLLVEDDVGVRDATRMLLTVEGFDVIAAASLDEAVQALDSSGPALDLLVTDYHLGSGDTGLDVITTLRRLAGQELPAILISGDTSSSARDIARDSRLRLLSKPVDVDQLLAAMQELLAAG